MVALTRVIKLESISSGKIVFLKFEKAECFHILNVNENEKILRDNTKIFN
jgi:hypothetical protein